MSLSLILLAWFDQIFQVLPIDAVEAVLHWVFILLLLRLTLPLFLLILHNLLLLLRLECLFHQFLDIFLIIYALFPIFPWLKFFCFLALH